MTNQKSIDLAPKIVALIAAESENYDHTSFFAGMRFMATVMDQMAGEPKEAVKEVVSTFLQCLQVVELQQSITDDDQRSSSIS